MSTIHCRAIIERTDSLSYNVRGFRLKLIEPTTFSFKAGQFVIINIPHQGKIIKRAYSIASAPYENQTIELCIQKVEGGIASGYLWTLKEGNEISVFGPHGNFLLKEPHDHEPVFMATGTGVAPMRAMIKYLLHQNIPQDIWLLFGCRYEHALLYESEFRSLATIRHNFHYIPTVSRPKEWHGETGHIQQTFQKYVTNFSNKEIYICGWSEVTKSIASDLISFGVSKEKMHYEEWS